MNSQHVDLINEMARKSLVNPPVAVLLEDKRWGGWVQFGPVLISQCPAILGGEKKLGYAVDVEVPGTVDPDYSYQGIYSTFSEAVLKAFSLWMQSNLSACDQNDRQRYQVLWNWH